MVVARSTSGTNSDKGGFLAKWRWSIWDEFRGSRSFLHNQQATAACMSAVLELRGSRSVVDGVGDSPITIMAVLDATDD